MAILKIIPNITNRDSECFKIYLSEVSKLSKDGNLSKEEEKTLMLRYKNGDEGAKTELIHRNLRFVISVANKFQNCNLPFSDLVNEGNIGLIKAIERFDPNRDNKFISYAVWGIFQSVSSFVEDNSRSIRIPKNILANIKKLNKLKAECLKEYSKTPSIEELSDILGISTDNILFIESVVKPVYSLDDFMNNSEDTKSTFMDFLSDQESELSDKILERSELRVNIKNTLSELTNEERSVIELFYGFNNDNTMTVTEISKYLEIPVYRITRIKYVALKKLKRKNSIKKFKDYI